MSGADVLLSVLAISTGASIGALLRWLLGLQLNHVLPALPLGTLAANLLGGYAIGLVLGWLGQHPEWPPQVRLFLVTGLLGGLTTFSTYSAEVVNHLVQGRHGWAVLIAATHLAGSLLLTTLGLATVGALD
ncbi:fluoride efflux transporter CrcB [Ramlibacter sp. AN1133]|uniref:fluoride efflux transporter CrcB n=1 Tax=Ramlibacter sp. AN1133 TaxID=3133429 RepID=UPI0030BD516B